MWLLIDDIRNLNCDYTARTPKEGMRLLKELKGKLTCLCLDNDLGAKLEGIDICKWACKEDLMPPRVQLVTSNVICLQRMGDCLKDYGYITTDGRNYFKKRKI